MTKKTEIDLDVFFDAAKKTPPLSMALMENILGDAADIAIQRAPVIAPVPKPKKHWLSALLEPLGGKQGFATVGLCAFLGVAAGYAGTDTLGSVPGVGTLLTAFSDDPLDDLGFGAIGSFDDFLAEG